MIKKNTSVVILAAGKSLRMGSPKFLLKFDNKRCFLQKIIDDYMEWGVNEIIVVLNSEGYNLLIDKQIKFPNKTNLVINKKHETSRFYSIKTGLCALKKATFAFIHNVDNPFVEKEVLDALLVNKNKGDYFVPYFKNKGGHPVLINEKIILGTIVEKNHYYNFKDFLNTYIKNYVAVNNNKILVNINSPVDLKEHF